MLVESPERRRAYRLGLLMAMAGTLMLSLKPVLIKIAFAEGASADAVLAYRMLLSLPVFLLVGVHAWRRLEVKPAVRDLVPAMGVGVVGYYVASYLDVVGLQYVSAQLERLTLFTYPGIVVLASAALGRQRIAGRTLLALLLTYGGLLVLFGGDVRAEGSRDVVRGTLLVLASAVAYAIYLMLSGRQIARLGSALFTAVGMSAACVMMIGHIALIDGPAGFVIGATPLAWVALVALFSTILPVFLVSAAIGRVGAPVASVVGCSGPVATSLVAVAVLGEPFGPLHAAGLALASAGMLLLGRSR
ncbi:DMT family transporter [Parapedomonas caeni]